MTMPLTHCLPKSRCETDRPSIGATPSVSRKLSLAEAALTACMSSADVRLPSDSLMTATDSKRSDRSRSATISSLVSAGWWL